jgi:lysozyme
MINPRVAIAALTLSASALVGIAGYESYTDTAVIPVPGDVPTIGFGTTGGVKLGDTTTPPRALVRLLADADQYARAVKRCAPVPMRQHEFDAYVSLTYNIGPGAFCSSTLARRLSAGDYAGACRQILRWDRFKGRPLRGLTLRRQSEYRTCMGNVS